MLDHKEVIKRLWRECKLCTVYLTATLLISLTLNNLRFGRLLPKSQGLPHLLPDFIKQDVLHSFWVFKARTADDVCEVLNLTTGWLSTVINVKYAAGYRGTHAKVVIRGSNNLGNWMANLNSSGSDGITGYSHKAYAHIASAIAGELLHRLPADIKTVHVCGGSLGGALSILVAKILKDAGKIVTATSVGGPKTTRANYDFQIFHVRHEQDPVPYLPLWDPINRYDHDGHTYLIKKDGSVRFYKNNLVTDLSLSLLCLEQELDPGTHTGYAEHI